MNQFAAPVGTCSGSEFVDLRKVTVNSFMATKDSLVKIGICVVCNCVCFLHFILFLFKYLFSSFSRQIQCTIVIIIITNARNERQLERVADEQVLTFPRLMAFRHVLCIRHNTKRRGEVIRRQIFQLPRDQKVFH